MEETLARMGERFGFLDETDEGRFTGPFNPVLYSPDLGLTFVDLQADEGNHTSLDERTRQVVILSVGSLWKAAHELYAHRAAARASGFSEAAIEAIPAGRPSEELTDQESLAQRLTLSLIGTCAMEDGPYRSAVSAFREKGVVDLIILAGCYHTVCGLLHLFAIPAPEQDLLNEEIEACRLSHKRQ